MGALCSKEEDDPDFQVHANPAKGATKPLDVSLANYVVEGSEKAKAADLDFDLVMDAVRDIPMPLP
jgi:hypothetical protein